MCATCAEGALYGTEPQPLLDDWFGSTGLGNPVPSRRIVCLNARSDEVHRQTIAQRTDCNNNIRAFSGNRSATGKTRHQATSVARVGHGFGRSGVITLQFGATQTGLNQGRSELGRANRY